MSQHHAMNPDPFPANINRFNGRVRRHPGEIIQINAGPHITREGKQVFNLLALSNAHQKKVPVMVHRGIPRSVYKSLLNDELRRARGRYVGPFPTHGAAS